MGEDANHSESAPRDQGPTESASARGAAPASLPDVGRRIGPYKLLQRIGEGGMGVVFLAEQTEPVRRRVALKLVKLGMDSKAVVGRFESERQALALMNHPNVAAVYDAGVTDKGRPYFVMEYVPGVPITKFCDTHRLTMPERLELFMQACNAIQHAHQKGIIHRDIKPKNVLVMRQDGQPVPKVIDFGVAKATDHRLTEHTVYTEHGVMIGTPEYMSPEQAEMSPLAVDTRTDVYSLGVLLYELLVGALPFEPTELRQAGYAEIQRIIREVEPPKPSTRFSSLGDALHSISDQRRLDTKAMRRQLQGDLDWITLKAIDKDPARRYASASELAADIQRHLNLEPVAASPPGLGYRIGKLIRRRRGSVAAAVAVVLSLAAGLIATSTLYVQAEAERNRAVAAKQQETRERQRADGERQRAQKAETRALDEAERATRQATRATKVLEFLQGLLALADPARGKGADFTVRQALEEAAARLDTKELADEPEVRAAILETLGRTYSRLRDYDRAIELLQAAGDIRRSVLADDHAGEASCLYELGKAYFFAGTDPVRATELCREAHRIRSEHFGELDPLALVMKMQLAGCLYATENGADINITEAEAIAGMLTHLELGQLPEDDVEAARVFVDLWEAGDRMQAALYAIRWESQAIERLGLLWSSGQHDSARGLVRAWIDPFMEQPVWAPLVPRVSSYWGQWCFKRSNYAAAEPILLVAIELGRELLG
ncbi:MAG: serine/threonine protein kinase, partial [Planctomycetota bacterium]